MLSIEVRWNLNRNGISWGLVAILLSLFCVDRGVMPELPEVETVRRGLQRLTLGFVVDEVEALLPRTIAAPESVAKFAAGMVGSVLTGWQRRGKYLLGALGTRGDRGTLGVHLRMTGQLLWVDPTTPVSRHTRVRLLGRAREGDRAERPWELRYVDQRTFGRLWWVPPGVEPPAVMTGLRKLGPEPFSDEFSVEYLRRSLQNRKRTIKAALLDQALVAGIGNIYADEALFLSGIHPQTVCADLAEEGSEAGDRLEKLRDQVVQVLRTSIEAGGTTFRDFVGVTGVNGNYGGEAGVYGRDGQPCKQCGTTLERIKIAGRSSHFCPVCQPVC